MLRSMIKMLHYLPEMHDFFKFSPTKHIIRAPNAVLSNRVKPIVYNSEEQEEEKKQHVPNAASNPRAN